MIRPEKMRQAEITVLERDIDNVIKYLGRSGILQFSYGGAHEREKTEAERNLEQKIADSLMQIKNCAAFLQIELPATPGDSTESVTGFEDGVLLPIVNKISDIETEEYNTRLEEERIKIQLSALRGFEKIDETVNVSPDFSFVNLKIGRLEKDKQEELRKKMNGHAVVLSLEDDGVVLASSKKDRFRLENELKKQNFTPMSINEEAGLSPSKTIHELEARKSDLQLVFKRIAAEKAACRADFGTSLKNLYRSYLMSDIIANIKGRLISTKNAWILSGWLPAREVRRFASELEKQTEGRIAISIFDAWEAPAVRAGREKIPVNLRHGFFARAFEPLVFSYGAPLYGTIDPTPITAFFFTLLFAIMFGDVGQGFVLFLLGFVTANQKIKQLKAYRHFSSPLKVIGIASMFTGLLYGSVFSNEELLHTPTYALTEMLSRTAFGKALGIEPAGVILNLMPGVDNMSKIFIFLGCTVAIGVVLNSIGIIINIINKIGLEKWEAALFSKNGLAGLAFFWFAISIAVRIIVLKDEYLFTNADLLGLVIPVFFIVFGPFLFRVITQKKRLMEEGIFTFAIEGIVEILETVSGYISCTVSFLRVGAFALSHAVLSFIIWKMVEIVHNVPFGSFWGGIIVVFGNVIIILLEGMIVAIQVTRLQYYEFFSKFFSETGVAFKPFRFKD
jgi:V/A-type H+-transporting ATPase subunit I